MLLKGETGGEEEAVLGRNTRLRTIHHCDYYQPVIVFMGSDRFVCHDEHSSGRS